MTNKEFFIQTWQNELKGTTGAVRALPADMSKLEYKPSPKCRTAAEILGHILPHAEAMSTATETFVMTEEPRQFSSTEEAASYYEKYSNSLLEGLKKIDDKTWEEKMVPFVMYGNTIFEYPMMNMFWAFLHDTIHHRGQLSTYYRSMGVVNPHIYGPTAEDAEKMAAANN